MSNKSPFDQIADHIFVLTCTKYPNRRIAIQKELHRLDTDKYEVLVQFPNPFDLVFMKHVPKDHVMRQASWANIWFGHYRALKIGYELGYDRILIIEDDIAFHNDRDFLEEALGEVASDYSVLNLDPVSVEQDNYRNGIQAGHDKGYRHWGIMDGHHGRWCRSNGCYALSREAMQKYIWLYESTINTKIRDRWLRIGDMWYKDLVNLTGKPVLFAAPNLATQTLYSGQFAENGSCSDVNNKYYLEMGLDMSCYHKEGA